MKQRNERLPGCNLPDQGQCRTGCVSRIRDNTGKSSKATELLCMGLALVFDIAVYVRYL